MEIRAKVAENLHHSPPSPPNHVLVKHEIHTNTRYKTAVRRSFKEVAPEIKLVFQYRKSCSHTSGKISCNTTSILVKRRET